MRMSLTVRIHAFVIPSPYALYVEVPDVAPITGAELMGVTALTGLVEGAADKPFANVPRTTDVTINALNFSTILYERRRVFIVRFLKLRYMAAMVAGSCQHRRRPGVGLVLAGESQVRYSVTSGSGWQRHR